MRLSKVEYAPRAESGPIFNFYMGKNTPDRQDFIIDNLRIELDKVDKGVEIVEEVQ